MSFNREVAETLRLIHDLMLINGENRFKVIAFDKAARALDSLPTDLQTHIEEGTLTDIPGIGTSIAKDIVEFADTGKMSVLESLRDAVPAGLLDWLDISGLGPKGIAKIHKELGITKLEELREACQDGRIAGLSGMGEKSAAKILKSIDWMESHAERCRLDEATAIADHFLDTLQGLPGVRRIDVAGSSRRSLETIGDIDVLVAAEEPDRGAVFEAFLEDPDVTDVLGRGDTKSSVRTTQGRQVDLRIVSPEAFGPALLYFTGSKEHNILLRQRARDRGMALNEYGLFHLTSDGDTDFDRPVHAPEEADLYAALDLHFIPPERREGRSETDEYDQKRSADPPEALVETGQIRGIVHAHSTWSDGKASIEEMARACLDRGYRYMGLTDHSRTAAYAGGLTEERVRQQWDEIERVNDLLAEEGRDFAVLKGMESDILNDGSLDYPDALLEGFDFVIASIHNGLDQPASKIMARYEKAARHPAATMIGHPTARLLLRREAMPVDMPALIDLAAETGTAIEINANPHRLDIDWRWGDLMRQKGVATSINPDAHSVNGIDLVRYGVGIARKGGFRPEQVLNTQPDAASFLAALRKMKTGATG